MRSTLLAGTAELEEAGGRCRFPRAAPRGGDGCRSVWLTASDASELVSLGVPEDPLDGDPAHSGNFIVRGKLQSS